MQSTSSFSFRASELTGQIKQAFSQTLTGYWQIDLVRANGSSGVRQWYLAIVQGRVICSGTERLSWTFFVQTLQNYVSGLQNLHSKQEFKQIQQELTLSQEAPLLSKLVVEMEKVKLVSHDDVRQALRTQILSDLDNYLFDYAGQAQFIPAPELLVSAPIRGFELNNLLFDAMSRRMQWKQLQSYFPSVDSTLIVKSEAVDSSNMTAGQKQQLKNLIKEGRSLKDVAHSMGRDPLEVAKTFVLLMKRGLVEVAKTETHSLDTKLQPEIFIVDDSPLLVQQFRHLLVSWGYRVSHSSNALTAVQTMLECEPAMIFLDINMPGATGFELIKQIRRQPQLTSIPLVLLTAEKTVSNQWRATWASCKFLAKPHTSAEIPTFQSDLRQMLAEVAPTSSKHVSVNSG